ncbi:hypothetical protein F5148DRAFT_1372894 [Russula earlei]|uniref:Uncharacterized protein n=1 Tax=Russula earlei TaxID=71964 RepID=A0ACC0UMP6_9AGAM|nr:hypothetical protein F5148DRAFT_1372894 [Russula earlei]
MSLHIKVVKKTTPSSSEIDDIFARKDQTTQPAERPTPEIVFDPSTSTQPSPASTSKTISHDRLLQPKKKRKLVQTQFDQDDFKDSRGTAPRRQTDEGFAIYKEDELGINPETGGTATMSLRL